MTRNNAKLLICNCEKTFELDGRAIGKALGRDPVDVHSHLCRTGISAFEKSLNSDTAACVACTQESPLFSEVAEENGALEPFYVNIRENAGWTAEKKPATAKIAALLAAAMLDAEPARTKTITSDGLCLVYGRGQQALDAAMLLNRKLSVTLLLADADDVLLPPVLDIPVFKGQLNSVRGTFGSFEVTVNGYASMIPSSRTELQFAMARDGAKSKCSVIIDLSGDQPFFAKPESRDGYFRADPADPASVSRVLFDASDYAGEFEKPIYIGYDPDICAHSRSQKTGCTKCIDNCPPGAITPDGDHVLIDTAICGGCGNCAAHCPTGAAVYQYPQRTDLITRIQTLGSTYLGAGGRSPVLFVHDSDNGTSLIGAMARFGRGLPLHVIPQSMHSVTMIGHDAMLAALAAGFCNIIILADPKRRDELASLEAEIELCDAILEGLGLEQKRITVVSESDPDTIESVLWDLKPAEQICRSQFQPSSAKRETSRSAIRLLADSVKAAPDTIGLPATAPYGVVNVDTEACTLCLACVSACPADALRDTPENPELRFVESACVQCGICKVTCPESAISLEPRINLTPAAMQPVTLYEDEPFECTRCGTAFGSRSTIERIAERLGGSHSMFETNDRIALLSMCDNCRLEHLNEIEGDPFAIAARPRIRTTDDYIEAEKSGLSIDDFIKDD